MLKLATLEADKPVRERILLIFTPDELPADLGQFAQLHYCTADYEVEFLTYAFCPTVHSAHIVKPQCFSYGRSHFHLFADAVHQQERDLREQNRQWNTGETSTRTQIQYTCAGFEVQHASYPQRMQHMVQIQIVYILSGNDIDEGIPMCVQPSHLLELFALPFGQVGEVFLDDLGTCRLGQRLFGYLLHIGHIGRSKRRGLRQVTL